MDPQPRRARRIGSTARRLALGLAGLLAVGGLVLAFAGGLARGANPGVRIAMSSPETLDPAVAGDAGSAAVIAQLFEGLTSIDGSLTPRPALASGWTFGDDNRTVSFTLRDGLTFSDGTPLTAADVARSWLRVLDPAAPSPLAALLYDVIGARAYATGASTDPASVGFQAAGRVFEVHLTRPAGDFPAIAASPSLAVVPPGVGRDPAALEPGAGFVASGGYELSGRTATELQLTANSRYWAGPPAISRVTLVTDLGGQSPVDVFSAGTLDWTPVDPDDAAWIAYDRTLGPQLRSSADLAVTYYGFDTRRAPFDNPLVRRAFAEAVDWRRVVQLADGNGALPATSMVPPGNPGEKRWGLPPHVRSRLSQAAAGPGGLRGPGLLPGGHARRHRHRLRRGNPRPAQSEPRDQRAVRGARLPRLLQAPRDTRRADVLGAELGRRLPVPV